MVVIFLERNDGARRPAAFWSRPAAFCLRHAAYLPHPLAFYLQTAPLIIAAIHRLTAVKYPNVRRNQPCMAPCVKSTRCY